MTNMIQPKVVQHHSIPIIVLKFVRNVSGDIVIHLREILYPVSQRFSRPARVEGPYSHEEARCPVRSVEHARE